MKNRRTIGIVIVALVFMLALSACSNKSDKKNNGSQAENQGEEQKVDFDTTVIKIGKEKVPYNEVMVYVLLLKEMYEPSFTNVIWDYKLDSGSTFGEMAREEVLNQIIQLKVMSQQAKSLNAELTDDELIEIENYANEYLAGITKEDQEKYGITYDTVFQVCKDNYLSEKVFDVATMEVDTSISDEDAKQVTVYQIEVSLDSKDKDGNEITLSEEEKEGALKKAKKLLKKVKKEEDFYSFALSHSDDAQIEYTVGKGDKEDAYIEAAFALKKDQISKVIETQSGYYILYCVDDFNEDATALKKEEIINERQDEAFKKMYKEWLSDYKVKVVEKNWEKIIF